jgi:hypothetical protein
MINLSDAQRILLSSATQRENSSLLPLAPSLRPGGGTMKALAALLKRGLAEERETSEPAAARRVEDDINYGVFITAAGAAAIGVDLKQGDERADAVMTTAGTAPRAPVASSKTAAVIALLARADGATLPELIGATGWLPHTTRAALTGIRKKGHEITRGKREGVTCYRIVAAA